MKEFGPQRGARPWRPPWICQCFVSSQRILFPLKVYFRSLQIFFWMRSRSKKAFRPTLNFWLKFTWLLSECLSLFLSYFSSVSMSMSVSLCVWLPVLIDHIREHWRIQEESLEIHVPDLIQFLSFLDSFGKTPWILCPHPLPYGKSWICHCTEVALDFYLRVDFAGHFCLFRQNNNEKIIRIVSNENLIYCKHV